jgi:hypothetical protein
LIFFKKRVERIALSGLPFCTEKLINRGIVGIFAGGGLGRLVGWHVKFSLLTPFGVKK